MKLLEKAKRKPLLDGLYIRWMIRSDFDDVLEIEQLGFDHPWTEDDLIRAIRDRHTIGMVAEDGRDVLGFMVYELHPKRIELLNLAVHPCAWRRRVGTAMIARLDTKLTSGRRAEIVTMVNERNLGGQLFLRDTGFWAERIVPQYFHDAGVDGIEFLHRVDEWRLAKGAV